MASDFEDLLVDEILSEKASRYRRNTIVLAAVVIGLFTIPGANLAEAKFFNMQIGLGPSREAWSHSVLMLLLLYNGGLFCFYAVRDFRIWREDLSAEANFNELRMYFGRPVSKKTVLRRLNKSVDTKLVIVQTKYDFSPSKPSGVVEHVGVTIRSVPDERWPDAPSFVPMTFSNQSNNLLSCSEKALGVCCHRHYSTVVDGVGWVNHHNVPINFLNQLSVDGSVGQHLIKKPCYPNPPDRRHSSSSEATTRSPLQLLTPPW